MIILADARTFAGPEPGRVRGIYRFIPSAELTGDADFARFADAGGLHFCQDGLNYARKAEDNRDRVDRPERSARNLST